MWTIWMFYINVCRTTLDQGVSLLLASVTSRISRNVLYGVQAMSSVEILPVAILMFPFGKICKRTFVPFPQYNSYG